MSFLSDIYLQTAFSRLFVDKIWSQFCEFGLSTYFDIFLQEYFFGALLSATFKRYVEQLK